MGTVFRKAWTAPLPPGAEVVTSRGKRVARWHLRNGKLRTAEVFEGRDGSLRVRGRTAAYVAKYRDRNGVWVEVTTGCKDEQLDRTGRERALIYKTLVLTGLRKNELASITVGQLELDGPRVRAFIPLLGARSAIHRPGLGCSLE